MTMIEIGESAAVRDTAHVGDVVRVTRIGLIANVSLAAVKIVAGTVGNSQAVVADGANSISDSATDVAILVGVRYWSREADESHPYGHRRIETLITTLIAASLAFVAGGFVYKALISLYEKHATSVGPVALLAALLSILIKEILYRWTVVVGKRIRSPAVIAKAWDHRADVFTSTPVALSVLGAWLLPGWSFLDHVGAVVVSMFIFQAAYRIGWPSLQELVDVGAPEQDRRRIGEIALETRGVKYVHAIRTRYLGPGLQVDLHVKVDPLMTVREGHDISEAVKARLLALGPDIVDVVVHLEPYEGQYAKKSE